MIRYDSLTFLYPRVPELSLAHHWRTKLFLKEAEQCEKGTFGPCERFGVTVYKSNSPLSSLPAAPNTKWFRCFSSDNLTSADDCDRLCWCQWARSRLGPVRWWKVASTFTTTKIIKKKKIRSFIESLTAVDRVYISIVASQRVT